MPLRVWNASLVVAFALLAFGSQAKDQTFRVLWAWNNPLFDGVYSPGLVLLWALLPIGLWRAMTSQQLLTPLRLSLVVAALLFVGEMLFLLPVVTDFKASAIRVSSNCLGVALLLYFCFRPNRRPPPLRHEPSGNAPPAMLLIATAGTAIAFYYIANTVHQTSELGFTAIVYGRYQGGANSLSWGASNVVASTLLLGFCATLVLKLRGGYSKLVTSMQVIIGIGLLLTLSRNSIICACGAIGLTALRGGKDRASIFVGVGVIVYIGYWVMQTTGVSHDVLETRVSDVDRDSLLSGRLDIWTHYIRLLGQNPFGFNGYYSSLINVGFSAHNWLLTTYYEMGVIGVATGLSIPLMACRCAAEQYRGANRSSRRVWAYLCGLSVVIMANMLAEDPQFAHQYTIMWWAWWAGIASDSITNYEGKHRDNCMERRRGPNALHRIPQRG